MFFIVFGIKDYLAEVFHGLLYFPCAQFIGSACRNISPIGGTLTPALFRRTGQTILTVVAPFITIRFISLFYAQVAKV